ncbi:hypothetical protein [Staphylococcus phage vB_SauM-V1SA12]|nr:hypothetical protein [Staphylococcus phage vB_SauM-V1SA12]
MIILYRENFKRNTMSELLTLIQDIKPNWTYSFNDDSEADVKVIKHTGINLPDTAEGLVRSTGGLVISIVGNGCVSECPRDFHAGMTDVKEHIRTYTYGK